MAMTNPIPSIHSPISTLVIPASPGTPDAQLHINYHSPSGMKPPDLHARPASLGMHVSGTAVQGLGGIQYVRRDVPVHDDHPHKQI